VAVAVAVAVSHPPLFPPGSGYAYPNTDYVVLGMVVHAVTGNTWRQEVDRRILCRLGLASTVLPGHDPDIHGPHAHACQRLAGAP
jgi:D-alanyl-D-alanine carboxypeptidase